MNGMKRRSLAALLLLVLGLPLVAHGLGATRPLAQIPLTPSRAQRYVFEPWTEEERAFYQTFQIAYALRGLAPLERWEQELLSADSLLKAAQAELADSISVLRGTVRAFEEEQMAASEEGPSPELSAALTRRRRGRGAQGLDAALAGYDHPCADALLRQLAGRRAEDQVRDTL